MDQLVIPSKEGITQGRWAEMQPDVRGPSMAGILVIGDEEAVREMISAMLRRAGYEVQEAAACGHGTALYRIDTRCING